MKNSSQAAIAHLIDKGVVLPNPESVEIGENVNLDRISGDDVTLFSGTKIYGPETLILKGATLGREAPVTVDNCYIGPQSELKGGYFKNAVFLKKAAMGYGAHVREGTILEEFSGGAHTVGLKQTILFPFVMLGSLINFCDCLMAGGTGKKDHSEVGSSFIHFNFTPNQDKATASLIGDVPRGVWLNQRPIFLGGQGGLVGPCRLEYGTITGAGTINRKDELRPNRLIVDGGGRSINIAYSPNQYAALSRIVTNNIIYSANLIALLSWYTYIRALFVGPDFPRELLDGLIKTLNTGISERIKRLRELAGKTAGQSKASFASSWPRMEERFDTLRQPDAPEFEDLNYMRDGVAKMVADEIKTHGKEYIPVIQGVTHEQTETGQQWLQNIVDKIVNQIKDVMPSTKSI